MALITVYDLLEVDEKASKEEIEKSYQKLIMEYHKDPKLSFEENNANEIILNHFLMSFLSCSILFSFHFLKYFNIICLILKYFDLITLYCI